MKRAILVTAAITLTLMFALGGTAVIGGAAVPMLAAQQRQQQHTIPSLAAEEKIPAQLVNCYPIVEDLQIHLGITICLWILPSPPEKPENPEREAFGPRY